MLERFSPNPSTAKHYCVSALPLFIALLLYNHSVRVAYLAWLGQWLKLGANPIVTSALASPDCGGARGAALKPAVTLQRELEWPRLPTPRSLSSGRGRPAIRPRSMPP